MSSFGKGLAVLGWIIDHDGVRADQIADGLDLPLSSTYRFLRTLRADGFVAETDGEFTIGPRLSGHVAALPVSRLAQLAMPFLEQLAEVTTETTVLTVRHGLHAICVAQVESSHQIRLAFRVGQLLPLHAGAGQRVLLAFAPEAVIRDVLASRPRPHTPNTPSRDELAHLLPKVRAARFAMSRGELTARAVALAVPVLRHDRAVGAWCVAGP